MRSKSLLASKPRLFFQRGETVKLLFQGAKRETLEPERWKEAKQDELATTHETLKAVQPQSALDCEN